MRSTGNLSSCINDGKQRHREASQLLPTGVDAVFLPVGCYNDHHEEPPSHSTKLVNNRGYSHVAFVAGR